ncbi:hypothetical protein BJY01DRAFT_218793 [Aspergillus pseudoustus]|uniref:Zn(2)-C6 fungal-type domain-containing protein n=1 Tax=Aspergillus pseudoustus TaxID=1810923 RepID=A0ABR4JJ66_9EURO
MVYPGGRSNGCIQCRLRKVKCDSTKPECRRCLARGQPCPGYPGAFIFCPQPPGAVGRVHRVRRLEHIEASSAQNSLSPAPEATPHTSCISSHVPASPTILWDQQCVCLFMGQYVLPSAKGASSGYLGFLPEFYSTKNQGSCLHSATLAVSYLAMYNQTRSSPLYIEARRRYGRTLKQMNSTICTQQGRFDEETFTVIILLSLFVDMNNERDDKSNVHTLGMCHVIKLGPGKLIEFKYAQPLLHWGYTHLLTQAMLLQDDDRYEELMQLFVYVECPDPVLHLAFWACRVLSFASNVRRYVASLTDTRVPTTGECQWLDTSGSGLLKAFNDWVVSLPENWKQVYRSLTHPSIAHPVNSSPDCSRWLASLFALVRTVQLIHYLTLARASAASPSSMSNLKVALAVGDDEDTVSTLQNYTRDLLDDLWGNLRCIRCHISAARNPAGGSAAMALMALWPAWFVANCPLSSPVHVSQARDTLSFIGSTVGIRYALSMLDAKYGPTYLFDLLRDS